MTTNAKAATVGIGAALENESAGQRIQFSGCILTQSPPSLPEKLTNRPTLATRTTCTRWGCRRTAKVLHVPELGGAQEQLCPRCWRLALNKEHIVSVRRRL